MNCQNENCCKKNSVPFVAHESAIARRERTQKRLIKVIVLLILLLVGTNTYWVVLNGYCDQEPTKIEKAADGC